jgi:hypothetical protein
MDGQRDRHMDRQTDGQTSRQKEREQMRYNIFSPSARQLLQTVGRK